MASLSLRVLLLVMGIWLTARSLQGDGLPRNKSGQAAIEAPAGVENPASGDVDEKPRRLSAVEIKELISSLASDRYETREHATRRLGEGGVEAVSPLTEAARGMTLEVTCRAIRALEAIAQRGDRETFESAQDALEQLTEARNRSAANRANVALGGLAAPRSRHARGRLLELGAIIKPRRQIRGIIDDDEAPVRIQVILSRRWKGGDEGLVYLRRMDPAEVDSVYVTRGSKITQEAIVELTKAAPHFNGRIQERGDALLGVICDEAGVCQVSNVAPNTAASRCGLQEGDIIVKYNGEMITSFKRLTEITREHDVGDKILLEVKRDDEILELEATLGEWE